MLCCEMQLRDFLFLSEAAGDGEIFSASLLLSPVQRGFDWP